jgi:hypothetical protein
MLTSNNQAMAATYTREPLPAGSTTMTTGDTCPTCRCDTFVMRSDGLHTPYTRSVDPNPDGHYVMQVHADWCPRIADTPARLPCPAPVGPDERCGAAVEWYDFHVGYEIKIPVLFGAGLSWVEATPDNERRSLDPFGERRRAPRYDRLTVKPCGHVLEGQDGHIVLGAAAQIRAEDAERRADETLAGHADLLAAAETAGHRALVDQYRTAVRTGSDAQAGLLVALQTVAGEASR